MRRTRWTVVFTALGVVALAACDGGQQAADEVPEQPPVEAPAAEQPPAAEPAGPLPAGVTPEMVAQGQQIFTGQGNCFTCHGMDATGTQLAPDLTDDEWLWLQPAQGDLLDQAMTLVRTGVAQPKEHPAPMPPMGGAQLTDEQIRNVSAYVLTLSQRG